MRLGTITPWSRAALGAPMLAALRRAEPRVARLDVYATTAAGPFTARVDGTEGRHRDPLEAIARALEERR